MADSAAQIQYRQEFIAGFEVRQSVLRSTCITEAVIKGNQATFLVADSGSARAVTRGLNGLLPYRADNLTQATATLAEFHDPVRKTGFNIFESQGDQRRIMQETSMGTINREIDLNIIAELDNATNDTGGYATASLAMVQKSLTILGVNYVDISDEDNLFAVVTPAFRAYLMQIPEFASADYVEVKPFSGPARKMLRWSGVNWIVSPLLTGTGGASEKCYMFHRTAIGHAADVRNIQAVIDYNQEQDYSFARTSVYMGSKLLQNSGIVQMKHDGSAYVAS